MGHGSNNVGYKIGGERHPLTAKIDGCGDIIIPLSGDMIDIANCFGYVVLKIVRAFHGMFGECKYGSGN